MKENNIIALLIWSTSFTRKPLSYKEGGLFSLSCDVIVKLENKCKFLITHEKFILIIVAAILSTDKLIYIIWISYLHPLHRTII